MSEYRFEVTGYVTADSEDEALEVMLDGEWDADRTAVFTTDQATDSEALDAIAVLVNSHEWNADLCEPVLGWLRRAGRVIES